MIQKPKIQYVGQFYVYGSEAKARPTSRCASAERSPR